MEDAEDALKELEEWCKTNSVSDLYIIRAHLVDKLHKMMRDREFQKVKE